MRNDTVGMEEAAVAFDLVLVNRTAAPSTLATPDFAYCLAGQGVVGARAESIRRRRAIYTYR